MFVDSVLFLSLSVRFLWFQWTKSRFCTSRGTNVIFILIVILSTMQIILLSKHFIYIF